MNLSPSKVDCFAGCQRLFYYRYIKKIRTPENKYFFIGNLAHKALEIFHKAIAENGLSEGMSEKKFLGKCFKEAYAKHNADSKLKSGLVTKQDLYNIKEMMLKYYKHLQNTGMPVVASVEKMYRFSVGSDITVFMKADRLDNLGDGKYKVVDYKTSSRPAPKKDELASAQIPTYGLWVSNTMPDVQEIQGEYQYLRHVDSKAGIRNYEITKAMMEEAKEKYIKTKERLENGCTFDQNFGYKYCGKICDFAKRCLQEDSVV